MSNFENRRSRLEKRKDNPPKVLLKSESEAIVMESVHDVPQIVDAERKLKIVEPLKIKQFHGIQCDEKPDVSNNNRFITDTKYIFDDFIESEKNYVNKLRSYDRFYRRCLKDQWISPALKRLNSEFTIFEDMKKIYNFHSRIMLPTLIAARKDVGMFDQVLIKNAELLKAIYQSYIKDRVGADRIIDSEKDFFNMKTVQFGSIMKIDTGELNFPVDRINRLYGGFIDQMKKNYETVAKERATEKNDFKNETYWKIMTSIEKSLYNINMDINSDSTPIKRLERSISENRGKLIKCDILRVKHGPAETKEMKCYLHENYLIFAQIVPRTARATFDELYLCAAIPTKSLYLRESSEKENQVNKHYFEVNEFRKKKKKKFVFKDNSLEDHNSWKEAIRNLLDDQLKKEKAKKESSDDPSSETTGEKRRNVSLRSQTVANKIFDYCIESEKIYVNKLRSCDRYYRRCLKDEWISPALKVLNSQFKIFDDMKKIYNFHSRIMLPTLIGARKDLEMFKQVLIENGELLKALYKSFVKNRVGADIIINLNEVFFNIKNVEFGFIIKINTGELNFPVDRISRTYGEYFGKMKTDYKEVSQQGDTKNDEFKNDIYWKNLTSIEEILRNINMDINTELTPIKGLERNLAENRGKLIKCDKLYVKHGRNKTELMQCYLHENYLVLANILPRTERASAYEHLHLCTAIPIKSLYLRESNEKDNKANKHYFEVSERDEKNKSPKYVFKDNSLEDHNAWKVAIRDLLENQLIEEKAKTDGPLRSEEMMSSGFLNPMENITMDKQPKNDSSHRVKQCLTDLMHIEKEYTQRLELFVQYISKNEASLFKSERFLRKTKRVLMFHSETMLPAMEKFLQNEHWSVSASGDVFIENESGFELYNEFSQKTENSLEIVNNHKYVCRAVASQLDSNDNLYSFCFNPFYIIESYYCTFRDLVEIAENFKFNLTTTNKYETAKKSTEKLLHNIKEKLYAERIKDCQVEMINQGELVATDIFDVTLGNNEPQQMRCFLFEKMIILTVIHLEDRDGNYFHYHDAIGVEYLRHSVSKDPSATSFRVWHEKKLFKQYKFIANDTEAVKKWIESIVTLLNISDTKGVDETSTQSTDKPTVFLKKSHVQETSQQTTHPPNTETIDNFVKQPEENISPSNQKDLMRREKYMDLVDDLIKEEEEYVRYLKSWIEGPQRLRIDEQIFKNTIYIHNYHSGVLLPALKNADYNLSDLAGVFIEHVSSFTHYEKKICVRNEYDDFVVVNQYSHFCKNIIKNVINKENPLYTFFIDPLRSITLYVNVIENLIHLPTEDSGKILEKMTTAKNILEEVVQKFKTKTLLEHIRYSKVDLMAQGRLLTQANFYVTDSKDQAFEMSCFLFEKMILFTVISVENCEKLYDYHDSISFNSLGKTDPKRNSPESFQVYFKKYDNEKRYTLTGSITTVQEWVEIIQNILTAHFQTAKVSQANLRKQPIEITKL